MMEFLLLACGALLLGILGALILIWVRLYNLTDSVVELSGRLPERKPPPEIQIPDRAAKPPSEATGEDDETLFWTKPKESGDAQPPTIRTGR